MHLMSPKMPGDPLFLFAINLIGFFHMDCPTLSKINRAVFCQGLSSFFANELYNYLFDDCKEVIESILDFDYFARSLYGDLRIII
jgi:hypothetical protein